MKLDRLKFAKLIHYLAWHCKADIDDTDLENIDAMININVEPVEIPGKADPALINELMRAINAGEKIAAIKAYRSMTGYGLKEAKDAVEKYWIKPEAEEQPARLSDILGNRGPVNFDKFEG